MKKNNKSENINPRFGILYWTIRKEYFDIMHDASQSFDKVILSLSTVALGFTFGLISYKQSMHFLWIAILACSIFFQSAFLYILFG